MRKVVYIAHPLGYSDRLLNRENAARWCAWAACVKGVAPVADWIVLSGVLSEEHRELGLDCDVALVKRCDELWLVGGRVSQGMEIEASMARQFGIPVIDLTKLGYWAPSIEVGS